MIDTIVLRDGKRNYRIYKNQQLDYNSVRKASIYSRKIIFQVRIQVPYMGAIKENEKTIQVEHLYDVH